jgi:uncharacterized membrane protein
MRRCFPKDRPDASLMLLLAAAALIIQCASAQPSYVPGEFGIQRINYINLLVHENGLVDVEENLEVNNTIVNIFLPANIQDVQIADSDGKRLDYDNSTLIGERLLLSFYLKSIDSRVITLKYSTPDLTSKNASVWTLSFSTTATPGSTIVKVDFPQGAEVFSLKPDDILRSPKTLGRQMLMYPQDSDFYFEYGYSLGNPIIGGVDYPLPMIAAGAVVVLILIFVYTVVVRRRVESGVEKMLEEQKKDAPVEEPEKVMAPADDSQTAAEVSPIEEVTLAVGSKGRKIDPTVLNMLEENEKRVVELIENAEGEITQAYIYKSTGIPKASLSDLIKRLEKRNIVERRRDGRTNWISLQEWVFSE